MDIKQFKTYAIILNYNSASESIALFKNLEAQHYKYLRSLVIDNNSSEEDQRQLKENIPSENLIFNKSNLGYAGGNNIGIEIALNESANYVWILNPDIRVKEDTLPLLLETINNNKDLAAVGSRINKREEKNKIFSDGGLLLHDEKFTTIHKNSNCLSDTTPGKIDFNIEYIDGSCILIRAEAFKNIGAFSEKYFLYFEETDWCIKAKLKGYELAVNSNCIAFNLNSEKGAIYNYYMMRNRMIFAKNHHRDYKKVRNYYGLDLLGEIRDKLKGKYFKPFFISKVKGYLVGVIKAMFQ